MSQSRFFYSHASRLQLTPHPLSFSYGRAALYRCRALTLAVTLDLVRWIIQVTVSAVALVSGPPIFTAGHCR